MSTAIANAFCSGSGRELAIRNCAANNGPRKGMIAPDKTDQEKPTATASAMRRPLRFALARSSSCKRCPVN